MIHYGKNHDGDLEMRISADEISELWHVLDSAVLIQRRTFDNLKTYIEENFNDVLASEGLVKPKKKEVDNGNG